MKTTEFLAMQTEYSARTRGAKNVIDASFPFLEKALDNLLSDFKAPCFCIGDYGAADGGTSIAMILKTLDRVKAQRPDLSLHVNYSDLPENDFNSIGRMLHNIDGKGQSILDRYPNLTISTTPVSFYQKIMPPNTLTLGYSATAMHWLVNTPSEIKDHVHIAASQDADAQFVYKQKAHQAMVKILQHRAKEMQANSYFLLVNFGINDNGNFLGNTHGVHMFDQFNDLLKDMVKAGEITEAEWRNINFPQYYRSKSDYEAAVKELDGQMEIVSIQDLTTPCPYRQEFQRTKDRNTFIQNYPETLQTWSYPVFYVGLDTNRSAEARHKLVKTFFDRYKADIQARPELHGMDYVHHIVLIKRI